MLQDLATERLLSSVQTKLDNGEFWNLDASDIEGIQRRLGKLMTENQKTPIEEQADQLLTTITSHKVEKLLQSSGGPHRSGFSTPVSADTELVLQNI